MSLTIKTHKGRIIVKKWPFKVLLIALFSLVYGNLFGSTYKCTGETDQPTIKILVPDLWDSPGKAIFGYQALDKTYHWEMPESSLKFLLYGGRIQIDYRPGWGESTVEISGRISTFGGQSYFDVFAQGMAAPSGGIDTMLTNYTCTRSFTMATLVGTYNFSPLRYSTQYTLILDEKGGVTLSRVPNNPSYPVQNCQGQADLEHRLLTLKMECETEEKMTQEKIVVDLEKVEYLGASPFQAPVKFFVEGEFLENYLTTEFKSQ